MTYTHALILGIVQGLTEFLPVSSSGHLVLFQQYLGLGENMLNYDIFLHFGTLLAVLVVFRSSIITLVSGCLRDVRSCADGRCTPGECFKSSLNIRLLTAIIIGTIPAVLVGLLVKDAVDELFTSTVPVLIALFFTGSILLSTFFVKRGERHIGPAAGIVVGIVQALAIMPGISRSGVTISAALFLRVKRAEAGEFSFLLSIPVIVGATLLAVLDVFERGFSSFDPGPCITGTFIAFFTGWLSLVVLMKIIQSGKMGYFGFYCLAVVLAGIILYSSGGSESSPKTISGAETVVAENVVSIPSSYDGAQQKVKYIRAQGEKRPLLVALHTWSYDYTQDVSAEYFKRCRERDWHCIFPDFRGANNRPEACGSEAALRDILDAVSWAQENMDVDPRRIFLAGASGGGHMSILVAGYSPSTWTAVSAWIPISDLARWHRESVERGHVYSEHIELSCGGAPGASPEIDLEYKKRSPLTSIWRAHIIPMDINAGIHDGHGGLPGGGKGSVPVGHSIRAYNELVRAAGKPEEIISEDTIGYIEKEERVPDSVKTETSEDPAYGCEIHLRRTCGLSRLTLFEGGHEIIYDAVFKWFEGF